MTRWPRKPLAEVATIGSGAGFPIADQGKSDGEYPFLKVSDMNLPGNARTIESWNNTVTHEVRARLRATAFPTGSVIFPKIGAAIGTNKKRLLTRPCCVDNNVMAVTPERGSLEPEYLFYLLLATDIGHFASDSNPPSIRKTVVEAWEVPVPPLSEQRRIVDVLSRAEGIVRLRREAQAKAAEIVPALFLDMFGDPATNPKNWDHVAIGQLSSLVTSGSTPRGGAEVYVSEGPYFIRSQNVLMNKLALSDAARIPQTIHEEMSRTKVMTGDVLLNITGASIGRVAWVEALSAEANVNQHVCIIRLNPALAVPAFLSVCLSLPFHQAMINKVQAGASRQALNHQQVRNLKVALPPLSSQRLFSDRLASVASILAQQADALANAEATFRALLSRAFSDDLSTTPRVAEEAAVA